MLFWESSDGLTPWERGVPKPGVRRGDRESVRNASGTVYCEVPEEDLASVPPTPTRGICLL